MTSTTKILIGKAETAVNKANGNSHPDEIKRALAATQLALAASNVELTAAISELLKSATVSSGAIKKITNEVTKSVNGLATAVAARS
ncbi:hypothetical protein [Streptomyces sp. NPDC057636]|uniref:hypothetical protein n=1 Tax=Streptomyces sp. NPDC057636 TaxID=3346189 RepID=UPI0036B3DD54